MDIREAAMQGRSDAPTRARTHLQSRIEQELEIRMEMREKGGPGDLAEIDRELSMCQGAINGIEQRLGELAVRLRPAMDPKAWMALTQGENVAMRPDTDDWAPVTEYGRRLRDLQYELSGIEHALSYLGQGVRT